MIIVSITGPTMADVERQVKAARPAADLLEFRLDIIAAPDLPRIVARSPLPCIATCRPVWEGGAFSGSEEERLEILRSAAEAGASYIDLELRAGPEVRTCLRRVAAQVKLIVSHHSFGPKLPNLEAVYRALAASEADVIKVAFAATDAWQNALAFDFLARARRDRLNAVAIAMGEAGEPSRVLYKKFGGWGTYAATEDGKAAAPGQIPASELREIYRAGSLRRSTRVYGVIGKPLGQSKGIYVHNALFRKEKVNAVYCKFLVSDLKRFMERMAPHLHGFSVTIPHKQNVMRYLRSVDPTAHAIGAVNTVIRRNGDLTGTNTDAPGALDAIERRMRVAGKTMVILGAGGAARAIAFEAKERGAEVVIANRTVAKARQLARELGVRAVPLEELPDSDILVNATSVGMTPHAAESPLPRKSIRARVVFDAVYNPPITRLLADAKKQRAAIISGLEMYLNQGLRQSRLFARCQPDVALMRRILQAHLGKGGKR